MAIVDSITIGRAKGSLGNVTLRRGKGGTTIASQKVQSTKGVLGTYSQMARRVRMPNIVNFYQSFGDNLHPPFESKSAKQSDFNVFVAKNMAGGYRECFMLKDFAAQNGCVVTDFMLSEGSLPSIEFVYEEGMIMTDISLGELTIGQTTTIAQFSEAVINNNTEFANGDQITCYRAVQSVNAVTQLPYCIMKASKVVLDVDDEDTLLFAVAGRDEFQSIESKLGSTRALNGGIAYIHSRKEAGETKVSTQRLLVNNPIVSQFSGEAAMNKAIETYGGYRKDAYLTPKSN